MNVSIPHKRMGAPTRPHRWRTVSINPYVYAVLVLALFLGVIAAAQGAGLWTTSGKVTATGAPVQATGTDPDEIKGWMTIKQVITAYNVSREELYTEFEIPADVPTGDQLKSLEERAPEFSVTDLRAWLKARVAP